MSVDIYVVGTGITSIAQITREAEEAICDSQHVLYLDPSPGVAEWLKQRCPVLTDLYALGYEDNAERRGFYDRMAAEVVAAALEKTPVTLAIHGHPRVGVYLPQLLDNIAVALGLKIRTLPGISALAALCADLGVDPCTSGLQSWNATDMLLRHRPVSADAPLVVWSVGVVGTSLHSDAPSRPERFVPLRDYLLRNYPASHEVTLYYAAPHVLAGPSIETVALGRLHEMADGIHRGTTLFVPPAYAAPICDPDLLAALDDPAHLESLIRR